MFSDTTGIARTTAASAEGIDEIEFSVQRRPILRYRDSLAKIRYFRTVYSNDMLKGDRLQFREEWRESISTLNELLKEISNKN